MTETVRKEANLVKWGKATQITTSNKLKTFKEM